MSLKFHPTHFANRHLGLNASDAESMLSFLEHKDMEGFLAEVVPSQIRLKEPLQLPDARRETSALTDLAQIFDKNEVFTSYIGLGYYDTFMPGVIRRNILENPGWYTAYTPYQAEISQGRLEALLNFQTLVADLTGMDFANASMLDEGTAAAEAMAMAAGVAGQGKHFIVSADCHPQTIDLIHARARPLNMQIEVMDVFADDFDATNAFGVLIQYPATDGTIRDFRALAEKVHAAKGLLIVASDLLALTILTPPGELGADIVVGSSQRFGIPLGYGGPHAGFLATQDKFKRRLPGRLVGVSKDAQGKPATRLALQTREQHIRREKATSNICTAQVLLAVMAAMYAIYHGPEGLRSIARSIHLQTQKLAAALRKMGYCVPQHVYFDTFTVDLSDSKISAADVLAEAEKQRVNLRSISENQVGLSLDETTEDISTLLSIFAKCAGASAPDAGNLEADASDAWPEFARREGAILEHPVFNSYHTETEMLRYIRRLEARDISLTTSMIPLGSCTMKLNASSEMLPLTWEKVSRIHPFVPTEQASGYFEMFSQLESWLSEITGFAGVSLQPNAGSQGEYAGLLVIREYLRSIGEEQRNICLIPTSAHGTNPASAVMAGFKVVIVRCDEAGNIDMGDLHAKIAEHKEQLAAIMVTYPSTHGVFEESILELCESVHAAGGQVYMDGANMNAQVGLCSPGAIGADVCHLNLHKTFCIPHGGGGPGVGPIGVAKHLVPFLPKHGLVKMGGEKGVPAVSAAPWGSASIDLISWMYIAMMGAEGLRAATEVAILNANYIAARLHAYFPVLYRGKNGRVAHECILDFREWKERCGIEVEDVAKRLIDYGFHAPTMSFPVSGTLMVEPTESESKAELDRFCDAMISIHGEMQAVVDGKFSREDNPLVNSPHTSLVVSAEKWEHPYSRHEAAFPAPWLREHKVWPPVGRIDNVYGDRNVICSCPPPEAFAET
ncbi:MAG: aminomethyl-transferring glycine dehydrogenase [Chthoniobacterales bacterium]